MKPPVWLCLIWLGSTLVFNLVAVATAKAATIAHEGRPKITIVVATTAPPAVKYAATELSATLTAVTGTTFTIANRAREDRAEILVGPTAAREAAPGFSLTGVGRDGIVLRTVGQDLILAGPGPRGTLYAVFTFLEDEVGCRWWTATEKTIPRRPTLEIAPLDRLYTPPLYNRDSFWFDAFDGDWAVRNKCNGNSCRLDEQHGGKIAYVGFVHTANQLIPPDKYFPLHPEWFSLIDGQRRATDAQLCLTNDDLRREVVHNLKTLLRDHPEARITSVSQNDNANHCQCEKCQAIDTAEGSPSGTLLRFVNAVAAAIEDEFPQVQVSTLAYQYTRHPPRLTRPRANVTIRLCTIECSFARPLTDPVNAAFRDDMVGWAAIAPRLSIWDYVTNFRHYLLPHPNWQVLGPNIRFFVAHHAVGIMEQGGYTSAGTEMAPLRAWVIAKLLWDPTLSAEDLIAEFLDGYYGKAGPLVRQYLTLMTEAIIAAGDKVGFYDQADATAGLSLPVLTRALELFTRARALVAPQPAMMRRVRIAEMPVIYAFLVRWDILRQQAVTSAAEWPVSTDIQKVYADFKKTATLAGVTRIGEAYGLDDLQNAVDR